MSEKYLVGMGNYIRLNDNDMMQGYTYVLWSDNTWEMIHSATWTLGSFPPLWYKENSKCNLEAVVKAIDFANVCTNYTLKNYTKLLAYRKQYCKERGIFEEIIYALMANGTWKEINRYTCDDIYANPVCYCNDDIIELDGSFTIDDIRSLIYAQIDEAIMRNHSQR